MIFSEPVVNVAKAFHHCFRSFDSAAGKLFFICSDIFGSDLFFAVRQLEGEALEELVHKKLLTTPPSCRVLNMRISVIIFSMSRSVPILIWLIIIITMIIIMVFVDDHNLWGGDYDYDHDSNIDPKVLALSWSSC